MTAKYSIVQYVPNPLAGECINIGVITWDASAIRARFVDNWNRARQFGNENPEFLQDFAEKILKIAEKKSAADESGGAYIEKIIRDWHDSIQFTQPRGSLDDADVLLEVMSRRVLRESPPLTLREVISVPAVQPTGRSRSVAARTAYRHIFNAVKDVVPDRTKKIVKQRDVVKGEIVSHQFDVVLRNGSPLAAVNALSFEGRPGDALLRSIDATAWAVDDVRKKDPIIPLAIFVLPPAKEEMNELYDRATKTFRGLDASVLTTDLGLTRWSHQRAEAIAIHHAAAH